MSLSDSIETDDYENIPGRHRFGEVTPLTKQPWNWSVALTWLVGITFSLCTIAALIWWVRMALFAVAVVAG
jgi:hypothetical protein